MRTAIFIILFALVFGFTTAANQHGHLAFGIHSFTSYGWPQAWLRVEIADQVVQRKIDWQPFFLSASTAAGIAGVLSLPVFLFLSKRMERV